MRSDRERLLDMAEAIDRISRHTHGGRKELEDQELIQTWVTHHIQIIGEAARRISPELTAANPEIPWTQIVAMRNVLAHDYFGIDVERVWNAVERDLPVLRRQIGALLEEMSEP